MSDTEVINQKLGELYLERAELQSRLDNMKPLIDRLEDVLFDMQEIQWEQNQEAMHHHYMETQLEYQET